MRSQRSCARARCSSLDKTHTEKSRSPESPGQGKSGFSNPDFPTYENKRMRVEVKVPQLPESVAEATLVNWHKKPGDAVKRDENLIDIETDKVVLELPAPNDGVLAEIKQPNGATVTSNDVIAVIDTAAKPAPAPAPTAT